MNLLFRFLLTVNATSWMLVVYGIKEKVTILGISQCFFGVILLGIPIILCKLKNIHEHSRTAIIAEAVKYIIIKQILGHPYKFDFTGMTMGAVPPENIISIEEIKDFVKLQEQYEDDGFYDELKMQAN